MFLHLIQLLLANLCVPIPRGASIQRMIQPIDSSPPKKKKKEKSIDHRGNLSSSRSFHAKKWRMFEKSRRKRDASRRFHDRCHLPRKLRPSVTLTNLLRYTRQRNSVTGTATPLRSANFVYPHRSIECCIRKPEPPARTTSFPFFLTRLHHERCFSRGRFERRRKEDPSIDRSIRSENGKTKLYLQKEEGDLR